MNHVKQQINSVYSFLYEIGLVAVCVMAVLVISSLIKTGELVPRYCPECGKPMFKYAHKSEIWGCGTFHPKKGK